MRDQTRISEAGQTMSRDTSERDGTSSQPDSDSIDDLLAKIRQLEEEKRKLEEENRRIEKENRIFKEILRTKGLDTDSLIAKFSEADASDVQEEILELRRRVNMNSGNSSMPPSSDKPWNRSIKRSLRSSTGRKVGGQKGHQGHTMDLPHEPDKVIMLYPPGCEGCRNRDDCESKGAFSCAEIRRVVDMKVLTTVTEYRALKRGPCPSAIADGDTGCFPEGVKAFLQYGDGIAVTAGILDTYGAMSDQRIAEVINGMSGLSMSTSTVIAMTERCARAVAPAMKSIADAIAASPIVNCDETGTRAVVEVETKAAQTTDESPTELVSRNVWIHGASNPLFTHLHMSRIRGYGGMVEAGVIPRVNGTIIHDCWMPYWGFEGLRHGLCNAHILRELKGVTENRPEHRWASMFADLLIDMKKAKEEAIASELSALSEDVLDAFHARYLGILDTADAECPPPPPPSERKIGRLKKGKERSLIERLRERETEICLFAHDFDIPFDNNLAERAFRFVKTKTKVSGCFRSPRCLQQYLDIMSYIDTARKHGVSAFDALSSAIKGKWAETIGLG